jgi:hypothetical protein
MKQAYTKYFLQMMEDDAGFKNVGWMISDRAVSVRMADHRSHNGLDSKGMTLRHFSRSYPAAFPKSANASNRHYRTI